ncbi:hypothetical protein CMO87_00780 [Candidatus Woesearchaeota archaeon]|nr:hypothetical protein [Candidatus Woesearchaeota archaeon]|tara:strand:- start:10142 stop:10726 length:585 start_codon:yes stop_codon:yes gene_type:complete
MASFKINIADPKSGKCYKTEIKDAQADPFMGLNIGEKIEGDKIGIGGYEFSITGGTDYCGFPMRRGILGIRKRLVIYPGVGFKGGFKGMKRRKTVCGHKINEQIAAINLKVLKEGTKKLSEVFGKKEGEAEKPKEEVKDTEKSKISGTHSMEEKKHEAKPEQKEEPKKESKEEKNPEQKGAKSEEKPKDQNKNQ